MVLTRGKNPGNATEEGNQDEEMVDGNDDEDTEPLSERFASKSKERSLEEDIKPPSKSFRSDNNESTRTPSSTGSAKSQSAGGSRSASRKSGFVLDVAAEDTPLSQRCSVSQVKKGKRFKLYSEEQTHSTRKIKYNEDSSSGSSDEEVKMKRVTRGRRHWYNESDIDKLEENSYDGTEGLRRSRRQKQWHESDEHVEKHDDQSYDGIDMPRRSTRSQRRQWNNDSDDQIEKHEDLSHDGTDGLRRSTRKRKDLYMSINTSWILGSSRSVKGYPTPLEEEGRQRRSARIRTRQGDAIDEEPNHIEAEEDESRDAEQNNIDEVEPKKTRRGRIIKKKQQYEEDMYSRVKRLPRSANHYKNYRTTTVSSAKRTRTTQPSRRRRFADIPSTDESSMESESDSENEAEAEDDVAEDDRKDDDEDDKDLAETGTMSKANETNQVIDGRRAKGKYMLRRIQPSVDRFQPDSYENKQSSRSSTPPRLRSSSNHHPSRMLCSPAHRTLRKRRQKAQNASSTSSSSSDDERFERRKNKSMVKARNRCLPMNFSPDDISQGIIKDRMKIGSSLADVDPMTVDRSVTFEQVGGLETYIRSLKEMVLFPLLYPEVFQKFGIQPPRGVLFYGPPGTGKTLVARALANECSQKDRRVAFFMRKGADCLSKWVGESERQLRLLFDQAFQMRPSIIFFDEIDGLAPVRSTRQDQIHSSIVSTLLALMDGLDSRGEVIVIGATNRLDAIDPALRRPGRFDREFHFPLPSQPARKEILSIHLRSWNPSPPANLINYLSEKTVGYCGADLKALCAEAALLALRRRYPQVYLSKDKLLLDLSQINVERRDFVQALQKLMPASQRSSSSSGKPLSEVLAPLLSGSLQLLVQHAQKVFSQGTNVLKLKGPLSGARKLSANQFSPRLLVTGETCSYLTSALLHHMERLPVHRLDLTSLYGLSVRSPEEACVQLFHEARRNVPSIIYLPQVGRWWPTIGETVRATFSTLLNELDPELPILLLVTHDGEADQCPDEILGLFDEEDEVFSQRSFSEQERRKFFYRVVMEKSLRAPFVRKKVDVQLEPLPVAPVPPPRQLSDREKARIERKEEASLRELRIFLREILAKMARNKLFCYFTRPVAVEEVPDYLDIIRNPMDLETMMTKIDQHCYESAKDFLADIEQICANALEYNPNRTQEDKLIRHRACTLRDTAYALIKAEMDTDFEEQCQEISRNRKARQAKPDPPVPASALEPTNPNPPPVESDPPVVNNGKEKEKEKPVSEVAVPRKRRKTSSWCRGVLANRRPKKGKTDSETNSHSNGNGHDSINTNSSEVGQENGNVHENESLPTEFDSTAPPMEVSQEMTVETTVEGTSVEVETTADLADDSILDESHCSELAETANEETAASTEVSQASLPTKVVNIDTTQLEQLLDCLVVKTAHHSLSRLLRLYSKLGRIVTRYSKLWDRTQLIQDLEQAISRVGGSEL